MKILVNEMEKECSDDTTVAELLDSLSLGTKYVAVERNRELVSHRLYSQTVLADGDRLEVVTLVGGG